MAVSNTNTRTSKKPIKKNNFPTKNIIDVNARPNISKTREVDSLANLSITIDIQSRRGEEYSFAEKQAPVLENKFLNENTQILSENLGGNEYSIPSDKFPTIEGEKFYQSDENEFSYQADLFKFEQKTIELSNSLFSSDKLKFVKQARARR